MCLAMERWLCAGAINDQAASDQRQGTAPGLPGMARWWVHSNDRPKKLRHPSSTVGRCFKAWGRHPDTRQGSGALESGRYSETDRCEPNRYANATRIHASVAVPQMRTPECARGGAGQSDRWRQYVQVRDVRQHLDDVARTINLVLNATHCPEDADTSSQTRVRCSRSVLGAADIRPVTCVDLCGDSYEQACSKPADSWVCRRDARGTRCWHRAAAVWPDDAIAAASRGYDARRDRRGDDDSGSDRGVPQPEDHVDSRFLRSTSVREAPRLSDWVVPAMIAHRGLKRRPLTTSPSAQSRHSSSRSGSPHENDQRPNRRTNQTFTTWEGCDSP